MGAEDQIIVKQVRIFGVSLTGWHIVEPNGMAALRAGSPLKVLPGRKRPLV